MCGDAVNCFTASLRTEPKMMLRDGAPIRIGNLVMAIALRTMPSSVRSYDGLIILGYIAFATGMLAAIYFASGGPSFTDADLSAMAMMP